MPVISGGNVIPGAIPRDAVRVAAVPGAAAGNVTVTGIKATDQLLMVGVVDFTGTTVTDLTGEFTISADDTINNTGGTSSAGEGLFVAWISVA